MRKPRGVNKNPIKCVRIGPQKFKRGVEQNQVRNLERRLDRLQKKTSKITREATLLQSKIDRLSADLSSNNAKYMRYISNKVISAASENLVRPFSPTSIALAQLEQESYVLNFSAVEKMREITIPPDKTYQRSFIPSRSSIQRVHEKITSGGERITHPTYSSSNDIVTLDTRSIVESIIVSSNWPGLDASSVDPTQIPSLVHQLPVLSIDATADGARLSASRGMIVHALKVLFPSLVTKLVPGKKTQATGESMDAAPTPSTMESNIGNDDTITVNAQLPAVSSGGADMVADADEALSSDSDSSTLVDVPFADLDISTSSTAFTATSNNAGHVGVASDVDDVGGVLGSDVDLQTTSPGENEAVEGVQSTRTVLLTGFCHGSDNDKVDGQYNYNRYV